MVRLRAVHRGRYQVRRGSKETRRCLMGLGGGGGAGGGEEFSGGGTGVKAITPSHPITFNCSFC